MIESHRRRLVPQNLASLPRRVASTPRRVAEAWRCAKKVASENGLSPFRIFREQILLERLYSVNRYSYYLYRLFNPGIPWEEKKTYLLDDEEDYAPFKVRLWSLPAPERYRTLYDNKLVFNRFFGSLGFPLAKVYGVYDPVYGFTTDGGSLRDASDLRDWLRASGVQEFVFKPVEGTQGHNAWSLPVGQPTILTSSWPSTATSTMLNVSLLPQKTTLRSGLAILGRTRAHTWSSNGSGSTRSSRG